MKIALECIQHTLYMYMYTKYYNSTCIWKAPLTCTSESLIFELEIWSMYVTCVVGVDSGFKVLTIM